MCVWFCVQWVSSLPSSESSLAMDRVSLCESSNEGTVLIYSFTVNLDGRACLACRYVVTLGIGTVCKFETVDDNWSSQMSSESIAMCFRSCHLLEIWALVSVSTLLIKTLVPPSITFGVT